MDIFSLSKRGEKVVGILGLETNIDSKIFCIIHVSFANHAHFPVVVCQQGRKVVQQDPRGVLRSLGVPWHR